MKALLALIAVSISVMLISCSEDNNPVVNSDKIKGQEVVSRYLLKDLPDDFQTTGVSGIVLVNKGVQPGSPAKVNGEFMDFIDVGSLYVNNRQIERVVLTEKNSRSFYTYSCYCDFDLGESYNSIKLDGRNYPSFFLEVKTPPKIKVTNIDFTKPVSNSENLEIKWETSSPDCKVAIILEDEDKFCAKYFTTESSAIITEKELRKFNPDNLKMTVASYDYSYQQLKIAPDKWTYVVGIVAYTEQNDLIIK